MKELLVATTNAGKLRELTSRLAEFGITVRSLAEHPGLPEAVEDGATFAENAARKAAHYAELTGLATLADDSGLEVAALGGRPGVHSARFAGPDADDAQNNALLLEQLAGVEDRRAAFVCNLCVMEAGAIRYVAEGRCEGRILHEPRGAGGFGYDPLFVPDAQDAAAANPRSFAEMSAEAKRADSHRGRALARLCEALAEREAGAR